MTTEALLDTVLTYPLLGDMFAWDSLECGFKSVENNFNGLQELMSRSDIDQVLSEYNATKYRKQDAQNNYQGIIASDAYSYIYSLVRSDENDSTAVNNRSTPVTILTPAGSRITALLGVTYNEGTEQQLDDEDIETQIIAIEAYYAEVYPNAVKIRDVDPAYNCHSYAWYGEGSPTRYYIVNPSAYMTDGSYIQYSTVRTGDVVSYQNSDYSSPFLYVHSAIKSTRQYTLKWGVYGVYRHELEDCPYYYDSITYWRLSLEYAEAYYLREED